MASESDPVMNNADRASGEEREAFLSRASSANGAADKVETSSSGSRAASPAARNSEADAKVHSTTLHTSSSILILVLLYTTLALTSWTLLCLLTFDPLTTKHYGVDVSDDVYAIDTFTYLHSLYVNSEDYFRAARIIQAITTVVTIPLTSAVCSKAAVIFVQRRKNRLGFTVRQLMALADKGWTNPEVIARLIFAGWKKHGSSFLLLAILLHLLGALVAPVQQYFLTQKTIQTPTWPNEVLFLTDIPDFFNTDGLTLDSNLVTVLTRSAIISASNSDIQPRLWTEQWTCNQWNHTDTLLPSWCTTGGGITLNNFSALPNPWLAQLPSSYNTGVIKQFLPRFNFSVTREDVSANAMPKNCANLPGAFYVRYAKLGPIDWLGSGNWSIEVCMPQNQKSTPWKSTRLRQDITEELYLNISVVGYNFGAPDVPQSEGGIFKITSRTTAGYFELPNYMNGVQPGPLLDGVPNDYCTPDCIFQGLTETSTHDSDVAARSINITGSVMNETYTSLSLDAVMNKGPLLTVAIALFGDNSFIATRMEHTSSYIYDHIPYRAPWDGVCVDQAPLQGLLQAPSVAGQGLSFGNIGFCIENTARSWRDIDLQIVDYLVSFYYNEWDAYDGGRIVNAFTSAIFLTTEQWLLNPPSSTSPSLTVSYDLGADIQIPVIPRRGIIIVSVLLGLDIACLFAMAIYSAITPRWTSQLDSFTMMRIGAVMAEHLPLRIARKIDEIEVLDEWSGFIGDGASPGEDGRDGSEGHVGELALGAAKPLRGGRRYRCYPEDHEEPSVSGRIAVLPVNK